MKTNFKTMSALQGFVIAVSIILVIIGLSVLAGWVFNIQFLRSVLPRAANMQFNTALGILWAGTSLWFLRDEEEQSRQKLIGQVLAFLILLLGFLSLSQYLFGWNLRIDELFIKDSVTSPSPFPGRMSPISGICFILSGLSLLWIGTKPSQYLALSVLTLSLLAVIGYLFDYGALYLLPGYISIALHSGVSFLILSLGILAARPLLGFMKLLVSSLAAGRTALFLLPITILLIILLGYAVELGGYLRILAPGNESTILVVLLILVITPLIYLYLNRVHTAEMEIVRLSRLYATLSQVNQTVVRVKSQQELFESICTVAVEFGQFHLAWIGLFNSETGQLIPVAEYGHGETRLPFAKIDAGQSPLDQGITGLAIRSGSPQFSHNIQGDPRMAHWQESSALGGYHSAAALPIRQKGRVIGLLSLYAADVGFFAAKEERNLLEELASNISFALDAIQVKAERERAEERFRLVVESVPNSIVMVDGEGKICLVNSQTERLFGYNRAELAGQSVDMLVPGRYRDGHADHRTLFLGHPSARPMGMGRDLFGLRKDGSEFPVEIGLNPIETEQGSMVVASIVDITERRSGEQILKQSEEQYRVLIEQAGDGIFVSDATGRYIDVNSAGMTMLGYSREELLQKNLNDLIPAEDQGKNPSRLDDLRAGKSILSERRLICKDGSFLPVEISGKMLSDGRLQGIVRDITERKRTMEQLRLSEERFSNAFRVSPAGITITRIADGKFVDANESFCRMFEFSRDEVVGHTSTELNMWTPEERKKLIDEQIRSGGLQNFELWARSKSGRIISILFSSKPIELEGETHHVTTMIDITERKRAEQDLQQSNARFTRMVDSNMVGIAIADGSGRIMLANDYFLHLLNVTRQDFLEGKVDWRKFTPPEWLSADEKALHELSEHGVCEPYEKEYVRADGSRVAVYIADALLPGPEEQIIALVLDITERKRAEEKLARQNQRLKVLREIDTAILAADSVENIVDAAVTHIRELIECHRSVVSVFDWEKNEALMFEVQMDRETSFPKGTQLPLAPFQGIIQTLSKNQPVLVNDTRTLADPSPLMQRFIKEGIRSQYVLPLFSNGKLVGAFSMSADTPGFFDEEKMNLGHEVANQVAIAITQNNLLDALRELNADLEQRVRERTADLEAANKELEAFSYSVSHDLRAPVRHISGFIELLNRRAPELDEKNRHYLATIAESAQQMGTLIDELLAFSRLGRAEMKKTKLDLEALVRQIIPELQVDTSDRDIVWEIGSLPQVYGDHVLLKSVLTNLISNALKFTKTRPQAVIELGTLPPNSSNLSGESRREEGGEGEIICYVRDNGVGFDMQYAEKLFGLFQRLHRADEFEGTGVGLANVRRIIHRHGGRTWAEGEPDRGATFYFSFPGQSGGQP